ncbi:MAG TPA: hypothetical protein PKA63_10485 [Oligoflexia bacterium]|nr:hypothetical protein [Oligoflexia bacterium]HMP49084.1 hypothetical protein [Oligoflexia bacterium]
MIKRIFKKLFSGDYKRAGYPGVFRTCSECGKDHYITSLEISFYSSQDSTGPEKCRLCKCKPVFNQGPSILSGVNLVSVNFPGEANLIIKSSSLISPTEGRS